MEFYERIATDPVGLCSFISLGFFDQPVRPAPRHILFLNPHLLARPDRVDLAVDSVGFIGRVFRGLLSRRGWGVLVEHALYSCG